MQPIRLIATDIDGTLLDSENGLPAANLRALRAAAVQGVQLALVTARKRNTTERVAQAIGLPCALIAHNGARIWDWSGVELRHLTIALPLAREIAAFADEHAIPLVSTVNEINYYGPGYPLGRNAYSNDDQLVPTNRVAITAAPTRMIAVGEEGIAALCQHFGASDQNLVIHQYYSRIGALHSAVLTHAEANKGTALALLCQHVGIGAEAVVALGDAEADVPMLRWAGIGVAMGNGMPEAHAAATWIAPSHDDAGFAAALDRFVLHPSGGEASSMSEE